MKLMVRQSKMARRLVRLIVPLMAIPLVVTVVLLGHLVSDQIVWMSHTMQGINAGAIQDAGDEFQKLGQTAIHQSSAQTEAISIGAVESVTHKIQNIQQSSLSTTADDFSALTRSSFQDAMQQSLATNQATLDDVQNRVSTLYARSAQDTQRRVGDNIEKAMLGLIDTLMRERSEKLASIVSDHVTNSLNFLTITAQLPDLREGNAAGQKAILDAFVRRFPQFLLVTVQNRHGDETAMSSSTQVVTAQDLGKHPKADYFLAAMAGKSYVGRDGSESGSNAPVLRVAVPVELYRGKVIGVLAARLSLSELWDTIRSARIGQQGFAYVVDQNRRPLLAPRVTHGALMSSAAAVDGLQWNVVVAVPRSEAIQPIVAVQDGISRQTQSALTEMRNNIHTAAQGAATNLKGRVLQISDTMSSRMQAKSSQVFGRLETTTSAQTRNELGTMRQAIQSEAKHIQRANDKQMTRATGAAADELTAKLRPLTEQAQQRVGGRITVFALVVTLVSCTVGCVFALLLAGKIVRPVVSLVNITRSIADGDLDKRVEESAPDEIGDLAAAFNTMAESLQRSHSELQQAEGQLVQSAKLASLGTLAAGVAHELNQPIAIIRGTAQQLQGEPGLSEDVLGDLTLIEGQTSRMSKIVKHLRTFCRTGNNQFSEVDVNKVAEDCFILIGEQLRAHDVGIEFALCEDAPTVLADANEIEQVLINLITNARDAMEGRPDAKITLSSRVEDDRFVLEVKDNGTGIPDEIKAHIFDPFFTTKEPGKGTGLGLSISHSIITKHRGEMRVHNDGGAVFTITLPLATPQERELARAA